MFHPRDFSLPEEILPSWKRARSRSSSSTSALPQVFEFRESSHKTSLEHHEEQIETILNNLDELPLERIEEMKDKIEANVETASRFKRDAFTMTPVTGGQDFLTASTPRLPGTSKEHWRQCST
ncbi:hypothetical protein Tco_1125969 [Tanacetum coccineum]